MKFYGTESETILKKNGEYYLIQSPDLAGEYEKLKELPAGFEELDPVLCQDLKLPEMNQEGE